MEMLVRRADFAGVLKALKPAVYTSARRSFPMLGSVAIHTSDNGAMVYATNLDIGLRMHLPAVVTDGGDVLLPASQATAVVAGMADVDVKVRLDDGVVRLASGKAAAAFKTEWPASEFPAFPNADLWPVLARVDAAALREALKRTLFAAATDKGRPIYTGAHFSYNNGTLSIAAADSFRLAAATMPARGDGEVLPVILPAKAMATLMGLLPKSGEVAIHVGDGTNSFKDVRVVFISETWRMWTNQLAGHFPDWECIIPRSTATTVNVARDELKKALTYLYPFANDAANVLRFTLCDGMLLEASMRDGGEASMEVDAAVRGPCMDWMGNIAYWQDVCSAWADERLTIGFNTSRQPCMVSASVNGVEYAYVVTPMRPPEAQ